MEQVTLKSSKSQEIHNKENPSGSLCMLQLQPRESTEKNAFWVKTDYCFLFQVLKNCLSAKYVCFFLLKCYQWYSFGNAHIIDSKIPATQICQDQECFHADGTPGNPTQSRGSQRLVLKTQNPCVSSSFRIPNTKATNYRVMDLSFFLFSGRHLRAICIVTDLSCKNKAAGIKTMRSNL